MRLGYARCALAALAWAHPGCGHSTEPGPVASPSPTPAARRPNIVLVLTDDLDVRTSDFLPRLPALMNQPGLTFSRAYVTTSLCAPSRASLLTGRYAHNTGVLYNTGPQGGFPAFHAGAESQTVAVWLKAAGYRTALFGKYLNDYPATSPPEYIPAGWDDWQVQLTSYEDARYYNYQMNENGRIVAYGHQPEDYDADVLARKSVDFIQRAAAEPTRPFFLYVATEAPHTPATYADRHGAARRRRSAPRPSFNEGDAPQGSLDPEHALLTDKDIKKLDYFQQAWRASACSRWRSSSTRSCARDRARAWIDDTYVFFTSDNGLLLGEHGGSSRKGNAFEEAILRPPLSCAALECPRRHRVAGPC